MKIKLVKNESRELEDFIQKEWADNNLELYGKQVNWEKNKYKFIAVDNKKIVGYLNCEIEAMVMWIKQLIVAKDRRRQGVGKSLMLKAEKIAKSKSVHKIFLYTGGGWKAVRFYKALGYKVSGELRNHYFHRDFIIFSKFIKTNH